MELPSYFKRFLQEIRPTQNQRNDLQTGHKTLRERLQADEDLKLHIVCTFLQGSYRRATAIRPKGDSRSDVDIVVVTRLNKDKYPDPNDAMDLFVPFLERYYKGKYEKQNRSFGIELSYVDLDVVITAAPSESEEDALKSAAVTTFETIEDASDWRLVPSWVPMSERDTPKAITLMEAARKEVEWKTEPLWIPNREAKDWEQTHPLEQIKWTQGKNARCNKHFVNVVKAIKWWQRAHHEDDRPKGYPLEHLIGQCCPDVIIDSVAKGVVLTFENIVRKYASHAENNEVPNFPDHGVPEHDVFARISGEEFAQFYEHVVPATELAREAYDAGDRKTSAEKWQKLFGSKFPLSGDDGNGKNNNTLKGPFTITSQTGDLTPRKYGDHD